MSRKTYVLIVIGAALVALAALSAYFTLPSVPQEPVEFVVGIVTDIGNGWSRYSNDELGISFEFPSAGGVKPFEETLTPSNWPHSYSIGFRAAPEDMGLFGVQVYPSGFTSVEDWLAKRQAMITSGMSEYIIERHVLIAGEDAIVTYWRETPENEQPYESRERSTAFMHDGILYVIGTRGITDADSNRIWDSFRFLSASAPISGCDQSATTTDCSKIPRPAEETGYFFPAAFYTEFASTSQSGKIDDHLFVDNTLHEITICGKIYRTRQIFIDGADVVSRIAALANAGELPKDNQGRVGFCQSLPGSIHLRGIIGTEDVKSFEGGDVGLPGTTYLVTIAANGFDINPQTGNIYQVSGYDGSLSGPVGTLWTEYSNETLGVSFSFPANAKADPAQWGVGRGETGNSAQLTIGLPSGAVIYGYATTGDYSAPKGGLPVWARGFERQWGSYQDAQGLQRMELIYPRGAKPVGFNFEPHTNWILPNGDWAPVLFGLNDDSSADYPEPPVRVLVNLPDSTFTGIGFVLFNMDNTGSHPASQEDINILEKIVTSIRFI